ncbi:MAG: chemotaxis protein CheA [Treponema sp.]|nr:chemotaxis protein CheA [Treponema sp.]
MLEHMNSVFLEEATDLLENLEGQLLTLEENPQDSETISAVFRAMHTIKGSSAMFGFDGVSKFTHQIESTFDLVRNGLVPVTHELINLTLTARDHIRDLLNVNPVPPDMQKISDKIVADFQSYVAPYKQEEDKTGAQNSNANQNEPAKNNNNEDSDIDSKSTKETTWRIMFRPSAGIMLNGTRPALLIKELNELGTATVVPFYENLPALSDIDPEQCYFSWDVILTTEKSENDIKDVFIFLDNDSKLTLEKIDIGSTGNKKIGEILIDRHEINREELDNLITQQKKLGQLLVENTSISKQQIQSALAEQEHITKIISAGNKTSATPSQPANQSIRVNSEKLDQLIDLVGEMVTFNARLGQLSQDLKLPQLTSLSELGERLILSLRDTSMDMRMLPIGSIFSRFRRLVRDLSNELGKNIELVTEGADTELDKTVIEKLNDPLVHLIRNAVDHGVEMPDVRKASGKNPQGTVKLSAKHAGAFVLISISDDGAGINREKVKKKAIDKGIIKASDELTDTEIDELIFRPGFSTAAKVSDISGRGVGMDVVKKNITALGGTVAIESNPGHGSTFILKIPLTLAIIEGMLVSIGANKYVIPLTNIEECLEYNPEDKDKNAICTHITARGEFLPCINMRKYFEIEDEIPKNLQVVVVNDQNSKIGIVVDSVIGNHQTVIKPLGKLYKNIEGLSGATILGDGSVALILDIFKLSTVIHYLEQEVSRTTVQ